ncbi:rps6 [Symbiodinium sp. KB8]|nr:rps6 [Symbiodinium sp. KB8]
MSKGFCYYRPRRTGERKRKSVRGCIVGPDLAVLNLLVTQTGESEVVGLTDEASAQPARLGPKRANHIRQLFNLTKEDDVRKYVMSREVKQKNGKTTTKRPKIQRLITPKTLARKRARMAAKEAQRVKSIKEAEAYEALRSKRLAERKERKSSRKSSRKE